MQHTKRQMDMINTAIGIIAEQGYKELTTKNLATQIGITEAALYRHFGSKHELIVGILTYFEFISNEVLKELDTSIDDPLLRIERFIMNRYGLFTDNPNLAKVMFSEDIFQNNVEYMASLKRIMHSHKDEVVANLLSAKNQGVIRMDLDLVATFRIIIGSMRFLVAQWNMSNHAFDLIIEGTTLWNTIKQMIKE